MEDTRSADSTASTKGMARMATRHQLFYPPQAFKHLVAFCVFFPLFLQSQQTSTCTPSYLLCFQVSSVLNAYDPAFLLPVLVSSRGND